jgi:hypothetical protein
VSRGSDILANYSARLRAENETQPVHTVCQWCGQEWDGPLTLTRQRFATHLARHHPDVHPKPRHRRTRHNAPRSMSGKTLEQNIEGARSQGGASWVIQ